MIMVPREAADDPVPGREISRLGFRTECVFREDRVGPTDLFHQAFVLRRIRHINPASDVVRFVLHEVVRRACRCSSFKV
jgi:hypothetical protein